MEFKQWENFNRGEWSTEIDVRDFIQKNYTPYDGDESFLKPATERTNKLWDKVLKLYEKEKYLGTGLRISYDDRHSVGLRWR